MRTLLPLVLLVACSHSPSQPTAAAPEKPAVEAPPGAVVVEGEDGAQARQTFALGFLDAVAHRDDAKIAAYTDAPDYCAWALTQVTDKKMTQAQCETEVSKENEEPLAMYRDMVPETFVPGEVTEYALDAKQGIYMLSVMTKDSTADEDMKGVVLMELGGHRYVVFPRKK